jgi:hypothetical protein
MNRWHNRCWGRWLAAWIYDSQNIRFGQAAPTAEMAPEEALGIIFHGAIYSDTAKQHMEIKKWFEHQEYERCMMFQSIDLRYPSFSFCE